MIVCERKIQKMHVFPFLYIKIGGILKSRFLEIKDFSFSYEIRIPLPKKINILNCDVLLVY